MAGGESRAKPGAIDMLEVGAKFGLLHAQCGSLLQCRNNTPVQRKGIPSNQNLKPRGNNMYATEANTTLTAAMEKKIESRQKQQRPEKRHEQCRL